MYIGFNQYSNYVYDNIEKDEDKTITATNDAFDFISKLIQHIPSKQFKTIRYFGAYAAMTCPKCDKTMHIKK